MLNSPYTLSMLNNFWVEDEYSSDIVNNIMAKYETSYFLSRLLYLVPNLEFEQIPDFLSPKMKNLMPNPNHLLDMEKAVERIYKAIQRKEKITIFGDYDVDGATSCAIIKNYLRLIGVESDIYIPDRVREGYGPNVEAMKTIAANGTKLLITVDCGTVAFAPLEEAHGQGMDAIVIDHHLGVKEVPKSIAIINPNRLDETTPLKNLCGAGVSFLMVVALNAHLRSNNFFGGIKEPNLINLTPLVALGTVCDVMNLSGLNRAFVATGLQVLEQWKMTNSWENVGLKALRDVVGVEKFDEQTFGFAFGPCINAGGRIGVASLGAKLLTEISYDSAYTIARKLYELNIERRSIEKEMRENAIAEMETKDFKDDGFIFIGSEDYHQGVIGILASRLKDKYNKPAIVFSKIPVDVGGYIKASARSILGIDIGATINKAVIKGLLVAGGGHAMAGGFTCDYAKVDELKQFFDDEISQKSRELTKIRLQTFACELSLSVVDLDLFEDMQRLKPFGQGNPKPLFVVRSAEVVFSQKRGDTHLALTFMDESGKTTKGMFFSFFENFSQDEYKKIQQERLDILCELSLNEWNGRKSVELMIKDIAISSDISTRGIFT